MYVVVGNLNNQGVLTNKHWRPITRVYGSGDVVKKFIKQIKASSGTKWSDKQLKSQLRNRSK